MAFPFSLLAREKIGNFLKRVSSSKEDKALIENFFSLSLLQGLNYIFPLITFPYLVRILGPAKFGLVIFAQSFIWYFVLLTDYGFNFTANRSVSVNKNNIDEVSRIYCTVNVIKFMLLIISFLLLFLFVNFIPKFKEERLVYYFTFLTVAGNALFPTWFFQGMERMKYIAVLNCLAKAVFTVSIFVFVRRVENYVYVPLLNSLGYLTAGLVSVAIVSRDFGVRFFMPKMIDIIGMLKEGWRVFISTIAISAYSTTRVFSVGLLTNDTITGLYAIADKLINIIQATWLIPLVQAIYPRLSNIYARDKRQSFRYMKRFQNFSTIAYIVMLPILFLAAPYVIKVVSGHAYPESVIAFRILLVAFLFTTANAFRAQFLLAAGWDDLYSRIHVMAGILGILLTFFLTYKISYIGPAIALTIVEITVLYLTVKAVIDRSGDAR
ncbi:MAG: hypothetical protein A2987_04290 [Omnitrophica bacterium RIFCSPLOWO2_01_FULL_45_10]|nr:MAG: hypothetical protein A2987_04290 [Omnitrophica bacterium RIFCSPLOWO2_01_FULL_45_10]